MLRKRSRPTMIPSPTPKIIKSTTPFPSPILFMGFTDSDAAMSPTSILETKLFSTFFEHRNPRKPHPEPITATAPIGLGIADALRNPDSKMVLFGSQLKIQIPTITPCSISPTGLVESPNSPIEFGAKNKSSQLGALFSPSVRSTITGPCLSASEMEMSEDYTCVIAHGPNPRTTHIFDNCIVESCNGDSFVPWRRREVPGDDFLAFCHGCKKSLGPGKDIFMYRGEKAFCSRECRYEEMLLDEEELMEKTS